MSGLPRLKILGLANTHVTPAGLARLKSAIRLEELVLGGTRVSDQELVEFRGMTSLKVLRLGGAQLSDGAVEKLQQALPNLAIRHRAAVSPTTTPVAGGADGPRHR